MQTASHLQEDVDGLHRRIAELERALEQSERRHQWRLDLAAEVHRSLLPSAVRHKRISVDVRYLPIEAVGGDYCQVRFPDLETCYITICDVTGHGVSAALLATRVSSEVRRAILAGCGPAEIIQLLNEFFDDYFRATHLYLTFFAARIDLAGRRITYSGAGHPSPLLLSRRTQAVEPLVSQNPLIGVMRDALDEDPEHGIDIEPGDRLLFYTDGLTETENESQRQLGVGGLARIGLATLGRDLFETADAILEQVDVYHFGPVTDDKTLIVAEVH
jgi:serine phosphatase RsbU (regulator of sigma subunit)